MNEVKRKNENKKTEKKKKKIENIKTNRKNKELQMKIFLVVLAEQTIDLLSSEFFSSSSSLFSLFSSDVRLFTESLCSLFHSTVHPQCDFDLICSTFGSKTHQMRFREIKNNMQQDSFFLFLLIFISFCFR